MKTAIISMIKNEQLFIKEWVDYHLGLGFDSIILYEDYGSQSHKPILRHYPNVSIHKVSELGIPDYHSPRNQMSIFNKTFNYYKETQEYDWILYTDVDEFLIFDNYTLDELFEDFKDYGGVWLPWKMYNANRHIKRPEGNVMDNYTETVEAGPVDGIYTYAWHKKSFVNMHKAEYWKSNHIIINGCNIDKTTNPASYPIYEKAWINHYFTKSFEDFCDRMIARGNMGNNNRNFDQFFQFNPAFKNIEDRLIRYIRYHHTNNVQYISKSRGLISGGNLNEIRNILKRNIK